MKDEAVFIPLRVTADVVKDTEWEAVLEKINRHTIEPLKQDEVFTFSGYASNDRVDAYITRMDPETTLKNYVRDLEAGTPLLENHDIFSSPYGRSFGGELVEGSETQVRGHFYVVRDLTLNGVNTNDQIRAIKAGIKKDMSVGFGGEDMSYACSSCSRDLFDSGCPHIPGLDDENGQRVFAWIKNARLREVSTVYKGATPGAYIDKARAYVEQGELPQEKVNLLERAYNVRFEMDKKRSFFMPKKEVESVNIIEQIRQALEKNEVEKARIYEVLQNEGEPFRQAEDIAIRNELGEAATVEGIRQLKADADNGKQYVADLIDKTVAARVKVQGTAFDAEKYKATLARVADLDFIKDELAAYEAQAKERFVGGRQTEEEDLEGDDTAAAGSRQMPNEPENIFD